jgi:hypothetical protein
METVKGSGNMANGNGFKVVPIIISAVIAIIATIGVTASVVQGGELKILREGKVENATNIKALQIGLTALDKIYGEDIVAIKGRLDGIEKSVTKIEKILETK